MNKRESDARLAPECRFGETLKHDWYKPHRIYISKYF